jgi:hypothetical protein
MKKLFNFLILVSIVGCGVDGEPVAPEKKANLTKPTLILPLSINTRSKL